VQLIYNVYSNFATERSAKSDTIRTLSTIDINRADLLVVFSALATPTTSPLPSSSSLTDNAAAAELLFSLDASSLFDNMAATELFERMHNGHRKGSLRRRKSHLPSKNRLFVVLLVTILTFRRVVASPNESHPSRWAWQWIPTVVDAKSATTAAVSIHISQRGPARPHHRIVRWETGYANKSMMLRRLAIVELLALDANVPRAGLATGCSCNRCCCCCCHVAETATLAHGGTTRCCSWTRHLSNDTRGSRRQVRVIPLLIWMHSFFLRPIVLYSMHF
jgi:hypothetical protein